ncbi:MAG: GTP-binding protein [Planctomycetes bacterium]|nr:GTP-binding protein [Planctomycetota bacterium]
MSSIQNTRVAVFTPSGQGAVAVIGVAGPAAVSTVNRYFRAAGGRSLREQPLDRIVYGHWSEEDLVVCRRKTEVVEIHCHGGAASISQILTHLTNAGCEEIDWQQWVAAESACPLAAEAQIALSTVSTLRTAKILLDQYHGALRQEIFEIQGQLRKDLAKGAAERIQKLLATAELGLHLTKPWRVVLAGLPNVGKSSLINALVGYQRAIVFDQPGTTRDVVSATTAAHGWPMQLSDTAGLHATADELESAGIAQAQQPLQEADLVLWILDVSQLESGWETSVQEIARDQFLKSKACFDWSRVLVIVNKIDLLPGVVKPVLDAVATSAVTKAGIAELLQEVADRLVPCPPPKGAAVPFTTRQVSLLQEALARCENGAADEACDVLEQLESSID